MSQSLAEKLIASGEWSPWVESLPEAEQEELLYRWDFWGRPEQQEPEGDWATVLYLAGRGWGKTATGAEWVRRRVEVHGCRRGALIAPTAGDVRSVMVDGESGIRARAHPQFRPEYNPSLRTLTWPNGAKAECFSAEEPERLRGPQSDFIWADEICAFKYAEAWDMAQLGLRLGNDPRACVTTTPKPIALLKALIADPTTRVIRGSTYDNIANLAPRFIQTVLRRYEGTRLGRQELHAQILNDIAGALWTWITLEKCRTPLHAETQLPVLPDMRRIVVAVDPAVTAEEDSDECGIVGAGRGVDGKGYVLADYSMRGSPEKWAKRAVRLAREIDADYIVAEVNNGGDLVESVIKTVDPKIKVKKVRASRGKAVRAEPIASLYEQERILHVGQYPKLEEQMTNMTVDGYRGVGSPDRCDALVWGMTELMLGAGVTGAWA